jgi:hypothetical protein
MVGFFFVCVCVLSARTSFFFLSPSFAFSVMYSCASLTGRGGKWGAFSCSLSPPTPRPQHHNFSCKLYLNSDTSTCNAKRQIGVGLPLPC